MVIISRKHVLLLIVFIAFFSISTAKAQQLLSEHGFPLSVIQLHTNSGDVIKLVTETAQTNTERARGLMFREALSDSEGMLFIWPDRAVRQFWMKNTPLSLDILFFDGKGILQHIAPDQTPYSESLISSLVPTKYVLELPAGDARRRGIDIGTILRLK